MYQIQSKFCFCTLAFGKRYRLLALLLAKDIEKYSPGTSFIVLTDKPDDFMAQSNIQAFKHRATSVKFYHDKRFAVAKALSMFNSCIFIDADMRILAPVPSDMTWLQEPGIKARSCDIMSIKYSNITNGTANKKLCREYRITKKAAQKLNVDAEWEKIKFVHEYLFSVTKDSGKETEFIKHWGILAPYYELNGVYDGEGNVVGLAAAKAGINISWSQMDGLSFFKEQTMLVRLQKGQVKMEDVAIYFEEQRKIEYSQRSLVEKIVVKFLKAIRALYTLTNLRLQTLFNPIFYYL